MILEAISKLLDDGGKVDPVILCGINNVDNKYVAMLYSDTSSPANIIPYANLVKGFSNQRKFIATAKNIINSVENGIKKPEEALDEFIAKYYEGDVSRASGAFTFKSLDCMHLKPVDWLIKGFMESDSLIELFGAPESGKSLMAIDWALCVASGVDWLTHKVRPGVVFYIAGEGHNGLARRFKAWGIDRSVALKNLHFYTSERAASFCNKESAREVELAIASIIEDTGKKPRLVVIDTLARNFGGGNENSTEDMTKFVSHIDQHIRARFNTSVLLVHHTGHNASDRGRGSSSLKAAVDTEYRMKKDDVIHLTCTKMKDAEHPKPKAFKIKPVDLLIADEDSQPVNGVVLEET